MASSKSYLTSQKYFKPNYYEAMKYIIPQYLTDDDINTFGTEVDLKDQVINSNIRTAANFNSLINVSAVAFTTFSSINTVSGISEFFVKQNDRTNVTAREFEDKILTPLGVSINDYATSTAFSNYLSGTLLPSILLNNPTATFVTGHTPSATHNYLIENLSWAYLLNTAGVNGAFDPSTAVVDALVDTVYKGQAFETVDGVKALTEFLWRDGLTGYYPTVFAPSTTTFTSGTQQLDNLKTWIDVVYSPLQADRADFTVRDRLEDYIENSLLTNNKIPNGPFTKFLRALSFFAQDINDTSEKISSIYDIEECPDEFLPLMAELIGWDLFGTDPARWRLQLRNAVEIYQTVGTKKAVQLAIDCILPKEQFGIDTYISELYESYVPYLIYYALATNSKYFKSLSDWPEVLASEMEVSGYSTTSLDENIKLSVDAILLETYERFKDKFGPIPNQEKGFNYRGRTYPIPPFEEYPYYVNFELTKDIVDFIKDRLVCFGCSLDFANKFETYIQDNALNTDNQPRTSSFLLFTSGYNDPPNLGDLIASGYNEKFEYASLWSGKSSHFRITLDASSFDFNNQNMDSSSTGGSFLVVSKLAKNFVPAHSIPLINLELAYTNDLGLVASTVPLISPDYTENETANSKNYFTSAVCFNTYIRGVHDDGVEISRNFADNVDSPTVLNAVNADELARTSIRRRNYEKLLPKQGYYDRTGFNMPVAFDMLSTTASGAMPLGFIPSSQSYTPVADHVNLPSIWNSCEGFNSGNSYYEYAVSNTLNTRGASGEFPINLDRTKDRGQLPDIYAVMHNVKERAKVLEASSTYTAPSLYELTVSNVYQSYANSSTEYDGAFPNSVEDYYNFSFGRDLQKLYRIYAEEFNQHQLTERVQDLDGPNLFSHVFGPILFNHDFEEIINIKQARIGLQSFLTSSLSSTIALSPKSSAFSGSLAYNASASDDMYIDTFEKVLSGAVSGVELVHTSGSPDSNSFSIFKIPSRLKSSTDDPFMFDNTFVLCKSTTGGLPRVRFDMLKYPITSDRPIQTNFLLPDHLHQAKVRLLISDNAGLNLGGRKVGMWIHTKPESGQMWSYARSGGWVQHTALASRKDVLNKFSHIFDTASREKTVIETEFTNYKCIDNVALNREVSPVSRLNREDFEEIALNFNTDNRSVDLSNDYKQSHTLLHRKDQQYVIEVFLIPTGDTEKFMLLDTVEIQDMTLKKMSEFFATGRYQNPLCMLPELRGGCPEFRVDLSKDELRKVFKFFNDISGKNSKAGLASRNKNETETIMGADGGSKLDYRYRTEFFPVTSVATTLLINSINIDV
jgi:hypothetical protein